MSPQATSHRRFAALMFGCFALGAAVALVVIALWRSQPVGFQPWSGDIALVVCPPFILSYAIGATADSAFAIVLGLGTVVLANGFLYAGVAAGIYAVVTMLRKRRT